MGEEEFVLNTGDRVWINTAPDPLQTSLHLLARDGEFEAIIARKDAMMCFVNSKDKWGRTPLHEAARSNSDHTIRLLAGMGADLDAQDDDMRTPLHLAAAFDERRSITELVRCGASLIAKDKSGSFPFHLAASWSQGDLLNVLSSSGDSTILRSADQFGTLPIHSAAASDNLEAVRWHVERGFSPNEPDAHGNALVFHALLGKARRVLGYLVERKIDWNVRTEAGQSAVEFAKIALPDFDPFSSSTGQNMV